MTENEKKLRDLLNIAYGQACSFNMLDTDSKDEAYLWLELDAAKQTGKLLQETIKNALSLLKGNQS